MKRRGRFNWLIWLWCSALCPALWAATPRADYQARVKEAAQLAAANDQAANAQTAKDDKRWAEVSARLAALLPTAEDVSDREQIIHVNNGWLHERLRQIPLASIEKAPYEMTRADLWQELVAYLNALNTRVNEVNATLPADFKLEHDKLNSILARSEYNADQREASGIQHWLRQQWERFLKWWRSLFQREPTTPGKRTVNIARIIIVILLIAALAFALYQLWKWWQQRQPKEKKEKAREILGVEITDETTTEDLLAAARLLAQQGDYRGAIRRAYIALLYELEQRGKLRLHRSKTNRDYLNALHHEALLYPSFAALTLRFEQVWYGQTQASRFDFEGFLNGYEEAVRGA